MKYALIAAALSAQSALVRSSILGQRERNGWSGACFVRDASPLCTNTVACQSTTCVPGSVRTSESPYYSQCLPSTASSSPVPSPSPSLSPSPSPPPSLSPSPLPSLAPPSPAGFVKVSGQNFVLNGVNYVVAGTNAYWLAQNTNADIDTAFADMAAAGLTTVRTLGFNDVTTVPSFGTYYQLWTNGVPTVNTGATGLGKFDYVISSAKAHGLRLIVTLTNNWSDYGGMDVYVSQLNPGGTHDTFYTDAKILTAYQNYIKAWVTRYRNEPTIMAWELANEPRCTGSSGSASSACDITGSTITAWATVVSAFIKSIDCNHLVAMGDEGWFQEANPPTYPYGPGVGINFVTNLGIKTLDFGTFHAYPEYWGQTANATLWGVDWITAHVAAQKSANKPVLLEEFGVLKNDQVSTYQIWWNTVISSGLTGALIWQAGSQLSTGSSPNDGFTVYPLGTVYPVMESAAAALKSRG